MKVEFGFGLLTLVLVTFWRPVASTGSLIATFMTRAAAKARILTITTGTAEPVPKTHAFSGLVQFFSIGHIDTRRRWKHYVHLAIAGLTGLLVAPFLIAAAFTLPVALGIVMASIATAFIVITSIDVPKLYSAILHGMWTASNQVVYFAATTITSTPASYRAAASFVSALSRRPFVSNASASPGHVIVVSDSTSFDRATSAVPRSYSGSMAIGAT